MDGSRSAAFLEMVLSGKELKWESTPKKWRMGHADKISIDRYGERPPKNGNYAAIGRNRATFCCIFSSYGLTRLRVILVFALAGVRIERSKS